MRKENDLDPFLVDRSKNKSVNEYKSQFWIRYLVGSIVPASIFSLIIFFLLLIIPITVLIVGINYRDPRYCPIEPRISIFILVNGSVTLGWIILIIIVTLLTIKTSKNNHRSSLSIILIIVFSVIIIIVSIFLFIWMIIGTVWVFNVYHWVNYYYDTRTSFYPYNYCQPELYRFTFVYLVLSYILTFLQICYHCFNNMCTSPKQ